MHPKTMSQQNGNQGATSVRKPSGSQRAQPRATMTTEYQERFLSPHSHNPNHPLKGSADTTTIRSYYVTQKWIKHPPTAPQPSLPPKDKTCSSVPQNHVHQMASKLEDYTSVYQKDFQPWKANKRKPFKMADCLRANEGLGATDNISKEGHSHEPQPFESVTSYRFDYVTHPVQPRTRREKPVCQTKGLPGQAAVPSKPKVARDMKQELSDEAREFFQQFKTWSLENKFHGQGKAKKSSPPADHADFLSTTRTDYTAHKCQRTKPFLPSKQTMEKSKEPFQATTTMKEDYKTWDTPRHFPNVRKAAMDWPGSLHPKLNETAVCHSNCDATTQVSGLECISNGNEESRTYWTTSLTKGVTWADGGVCQDPPTTKYSAAWF
ncbi:stabilizer of axonemal microtubules 2 isoform X2 [Sander lucioperca]|uniref:stabilizer of axonemal microtubules 2 isoform X2 n=1 Tax=Sander lucioperca TaxID=283035 RepID=UPI001653720B|nr:stabilizer of axonemal microtubules 2 isoform X2 [Sander lucioperca]